MKLKTLSPYIFGLMSLIISFGLVSQAKLAQGERLPSPTPTATPLPKPEPFPDAARLARCEELSQPKFFFYIPTLTSDVPQHFIISGTVYAPDLSPLSNALVEINTQVNEPILFTVTRRTDEVGHYEFTFRKPIPSEPTYFRYRITHQDYCSLVIYLHLFLELPSKPDKHIVAQVQIVGPVLRGPVDIVMPVPPLLDYRVR